MGQLIGGYSKTIYAVLGAVGFVALIDTSMISPIIAAYARYLGADVFTAGLISGIYSLVSIPMIIFSGYLSDVFGRRRVVALGLAGDLLVMALYALAPNASVLLATRIFHAVFDSLIVPSALALIGDVFTRNLGQPLSLFWIFVALAIILGSASASGLVATLGFQPVYVLIGVLIAGCLATTFKGLPAWASAGGRGRGGARLIKKYAPRVAISMASTLSMYLLIGGIIGTLPTILIDRFGLDERGAAAQIGVFMALSTAVSIPVMPLSARLAEKRTPLAPLLIGLAATAASALTIELGAGSLSFRVVASAIFGISLGTIILSSSYLVVSLPGEVRGLGSGLNQSASLLGVALGAPLTSLYVTTLGDAGVFIIFGAFPPLIVGAWLLSVGRSWIGALKP
ncbi:MAG: MFS transporter [Nitrososphaerota archaeon]|nr:MFS transporter [Candidatus Calditenuaceae archaeon]MDW8073675.1 MFS transporter [Nitrososphaerota archaeon]